MKKVPPFVANHEDDTHCVPAVFRMLNQHYFGEDFSWNEIDEIMKSIPNKGTWSFTGSTYLAKRGLNVTDVTLIDVKQLVINPKAYLTTLYGPEKVDYYLNKSNLLSVMQYMPEYLKYVKLETRASSTEEVIKHLNEGSIVTLELNPRILNNKPGYSLHYVLVYEFDGKNIYMHDPGLPPQESRKVPVEKFKESFEYAGANPSISIYKK